MLLSEAQKGQKVKFVAVQSGQGLKSRLASLGLMPGMEIHVVRNDARGPFIVGVRGSRVILGRGMAERIEVE